MKAPLTPRLSSSNTEIISSNNGSIVQRTMSALSYNAFYALLGSHNRDFSNAKLFIKHDLDPTLRANFYLYCNNLELGNGRNTCICRLDKAPSEFDLDINVFVPNFKRFVTRDNASYGSELQLVSFQFLQSSVLTGYYRTGALITNPYSVVYSSVNGTYISPRTWCLMRLTNSLTNPYISGVLPIAFASRFCNDTLNSLIFSATHLLSTPNNKLYLYLEFEYFSESGFTETPYIESIADYRTLYTFDRYVIAPEDMSNKYLYIPIYEHPDVQPGEEAYVYMFKIACPLSSNTSVGIRSGLVLLPENDDSSINTAQYLDFDVLPFVFNELDGYIELT